MSAEHGHASGIPIFEELSEEAAPVWSSIYSIFSAFLFGLFAFLDIMPKPEVSHGGH